MSFSVWFCYFVCCLVVSEMIWFRVQKRASFQVNQGNQAIQFTKSKPITYWYCWTSACYFLWHCSCLLMLLKILILLLLESRRSIFCGFLVRWNMNLKHHRLLFTPHLKTSLLQVLRGRGLTYHIQRFHFWEKSNCPWRCPADYWTFAGSVPFVMLL